MNLVQNFDNFFLHAPLPRNTLEGPCGILNRETERNVLYNFESRMRNMNTKIGLLTLCL